MTMTINGSGSIGGLSAGGLPAAVVQPNNLVQALTLATTQNTTSGTSVDFTGIPSWVKRITVMFNGVSTNGTTPVMLQIGNNTPESTGYMCSGSSVASTVASTLFTTGFGIGQTSQAAAFVRHGVITLSLLNASLNLWAISGLLGLSDQAATIFVGGSKSIPAVLNILRLTTVSGTDTFDAGSVNILYEG
ncbi:MAG: hypothetical protein QFB87_05170 [Patescibacteria group bacterium]|nr:hypothetical protein [Patescibacteria group bacterium]